MYRISRVLETPSVAIIKIAGQVTDTDLGAWKSFVEELGSEGGFEAEPTHWTVLDFCDVSSVGRQAAELLIQLLPPNVLLLNGTTAIKNMAASAGHTSQILEPHDAVAVNAAGAAGNPGNPRRKETS